MRNRIRQQGIDSSAPKRLQRLEGWPSTAAFLAGRRRVTQQGVWYCMWWTVHATEYYKGRIEIGGVYLPLSWSVHHNFVRDGTGRYSERARACTPPSPPWANFSNLMECTPESGHCHSDYSVVHAACPDGPHHLARSGADLHVLLNAQKTPSWAATSRKEDTWLGARVGLRPLRQDPISQLLQLQWLFLSKYFHDKNVRTKNFTIKVPVLRSDGKETLTTNWEAFWQTQ